MTRKRSRNSGLARGNSPAGELHKKDYHRQQSRDITSYDSDSLDRRLRIFVLLNEVADLLLTKPEIDPGALEFLGQLQLRLSVKSRAQDRDEPEELPSEAPAKWLDRKNRKETPVEFILREYRPWIGRISRANIKILDGSLYSALYRYILKGGDLPTEFDVPTQKEVNTRLLERAGYLSGRISDEQREAVRLYHIAMRRPSGKKKS